MKYALTFVVAMVMGSGVGAQFSPTVVFTCATGPVYTFEVTDGVVGGKIYIGGQCASQTFTTAASQTFTFDATACTVGTIAPIGTQFDVYIQQHADFEVSTDILVKSTCNADFTAVTQAVTVASVRPDTTAIDKTGNLAPTVEMIVVEGSSDTKLTTGTVGDAARIKISIAFGQESVFGFKVKTLSYTGTTTIDLIESYCIDPAYSSIVSAQPGLSTAKGVLYVPFALFRPVSSATIEATALTLSVVVDVCNVATCTAPICATRRRRRDDGSDLTSVNGTSKTVTMSASILVYPPGQEPKNKNQLAGDLDDDVCIARAPMLGLLLGLCTALVVCLCVSTWLFCKLRKSGERSNAKDAFSNNGYKN